MYFPRIAFFMGILALGVPGGRADLTMVQEIENFDDKDSGHKEQFVLQISGNRVRLDVGQMMSSIMLKEKKITYSILHESQQYTVLPHAQAGGTGVTPQGGTSTKTMEKPTLEATGKKEKINGYACRQVLSKDKAGTVIEIWLSEDAMDIKTFLKEFQNFGESSISQMLADLEKHPELRGVPIRVVQYEGPKMRMRSTVKRLDTGKVPDSAFEVPAGYAEIKLPDMKERGD